MPGEGGLDHRQAGPYHVFPPSPLGRRRSRQNSYSGSTISICSGVSPTWGRRKRRGGSIYQCILESPVGTLSGQDVPLKVHPWSISTRVMPFFSWRNTAPLSVI